MRFEDYEGYKADDNDHNRTEDSSVGALDGAVGDLAIEHCDVLLVANDREERGKGYTDSIHFDTAGGRL